MSIVLLQVKTVEKNFLSSPRHDPPVESVKRVLDFNQDIHDAMQVFLCMIASKKDTSYNIYIYNIYIYIYHIYIYKYVYLLLQYKVYVPILAHPAR